MTNEFKNNLGDEMSNTLLGYYIDMVFRLEKTIFDAEFEKIGITFSQFKVLNWLWRKGELTQKEIHVYNQIKPSSLTRILNILIKKELIEKYQDPNDARIKKVRTTQKGKTLEPLAWEIIQDYDSKLISILGQDNYKATIESLGKLQSELLVHVDRKYGISYE